MMDDDQQQTPEDQTHTTPEDQAGDNAPEVDPDTIVTIEWRDLKFTVPKDRNDWDMHVQFEFEDGRSARALFTLLGGNGPAGLSKVRAKVYRAAKTARELGEFLKHVAEVLNKECVGSLP
jgi:hypothetical protein